MSAYLHQHQFSLARLLFKLRRKLVEWIGIPMKYPLNFWFAFAHRHLRHQRKFIYTLNPPPHLTNIGDHAQTLAIRSWLQRHYPSIPVIELDKMQSEYYLPALQWLTQPEDVILLQSGGNLGERGMWTERIRRLIISQFPKNAIVSLPQSIQFSDTPLGQTERENTRRIYGAHPNLVMIARDPVSYEIAQDLFPQAKLACMPDFVLALPPKDSPSHQPPQVLLCLRDPKFDTQSALTVEKHQQIADSLPYACQFMDTEIETPIALRQQAAVVERTLQAFCQADVIVTDRFHGLIFAVVCKKPCVVLPTVDHKLTAGIQWFKDLPFIALAPTLADVPAVVDRCLAVSDRQVPDWHALYFDRLCDLIPLPHGAVESSSEAVSV